ncbi:hypothetical protein T4B_12117 [Trichinella pseudospiralis]|uniref:Uncharacterized protein n=1 Tax=Trichinella pseudospiralis TaxID=6337 RepID=A0A0V1GHQ7_TRIPS|nr:hypothetical protein T4B_12117 [Trichinella pseudospiralis]
MKATAYINFAAGKAKYCINSNLSHYPKPRLTEWGPTGNRIPLVIFCSASCRPRSASPRPVFTFSFLRCSSL